MKEHRLGCFCKFCTTLDRVRLLRANLEAAEKSLRALDLAQHLTPEVLNTIIDAQRYDVSRRGPPLRYAVQVSESR